MKLWMRGLSVLSSLACTCSLAASPPVVVTAQGSVQGIVSGDVESFRGIPFAQAPIGDLRWRSPKAPAHWQGVRDGAHFGANCYQAPAASFGPYTAEFLIGEGVSEDCLFLNVWAAPARAKLKPVYLFIHGGGFGSGSGSIPIYDGTDLAAKGVVVVTINYRLGVFGYLAHPELTAESSIKSSGNYGMEDVIAALHWVHDNIKNFGGDPNLVTISGQSAGAGAVNGLLMAPSAKGLFARAIAESGSGMGIRVPTLKEAEQSGVAFAATAHALSVKALRAMSAADLLKAATPPAPTPGKPPAPTVRFLPNIDGVVIAASLEAENRPAVAVPLLTGFNADEGALFGGLSNTRAEFEAVVRKGFDSYADRVLALYPHADDQQARASSELLTRDRYMASLLTFSETREKSSGHKVYDYFFDHAYPIPDTAKYGAFHTAEVPYVFGALKQEGRTFTAADRKVSAQLQTVWIQFMQSGDPNGGALPHWPSAADAAGQVMELGDKLGLRLSVSSPERLQLFEEFVRSGHPLTRL